MKTSYLPKKLDMSNRRILIIGIVICVVVAGICFGLDYYRKYQKLLGHWQANFIVLPNKMNIKQLELIELKFYKDGSVEYSNKNTEFTDSVTKNEYGTSHNTGTSSVTQSLPGKFYFLWNRIYINLPKDAQTIRFHQPFIIKSYSQDPTAEKPFTMLTSLVEFDPQGKLVLSKDRTSPSIVFVREGQDYENIPTEFEVSSLYNPEIEPLRRGRLVRTRTDFQEAPAYETPAYETPASKEAWEKVQKDQQELDIWIEKEKERYEQSLIDAEKNQFELLVDAYESSLRKRNPEMLDWQIELEIEKFVEEVKAVPPEQRNNIFFERDLLDR